MAFVGGKGQPMERAFCILINQLTFMVGLTEQKLRLAIVFLGRATNVFQTTALVGTANSALKQQSTQLRHGTNMAVIGGILQQLERKT